jgi:CubicO group peptidase (beta-lactamase class C family)
MSPSSEFRPAFRKSDTPGIQYFVVDARKILFEYNDGWADLASRRPVSGLTTMMAYSMSKTITAAAVLQLAETGKLQLDGALSHFYPDSPYRPAVTIRQLLCHTSGIPNPIPLRWVHPISAAFDESAALSAVVRKYSRLAYIPGTKFAYSNIGYWLLGAVVERVAGEAFTSYVTTHVLNRLGASPAELAYIVTHPTLHASGYLEKYSLTNLFKGFLIDRQLIGDYSGRWLKIQNHYVNGPAFGGLVGSARGFGKFLQDQLQTRSSLFADETRELLYSQQRIAHGKTIQMTLGWHIGSLDNIQYFYKEGGGGGFHCMMRLYPPAGIGTVVMANATAFSVKAFLDSNDKHFIGGR